jgi:uncharacterized protein with HEPN domain
VSPSSERYRAALTDIVENIEAVESYALGMDRATFASDRRTSDAVERCLMRISEAAIRLGDAAARLCPDQPWPDIRGIGNHLRHRYDRVEASTIWLVVTRDLPLLKRACIAALKSFVRSGPDT